MQAPLIIIFQHKVSTELGRMISSHHRSITIVNKHTIKVVRWWGNCNTCFMPSLAQLFSLTWQGFFRHAEGKLSPFLSPANSAATFSSQRVGIKLWHVDSRVYLCLGESFAGVEHISNLTLGVKRRPSSLFCCSLHWSTNQREQVSTV